MSEKDAMKERDKTGERDRKSTSSPSYKKERIVNARSEKRNKPIEQRRQSSEHLQRRARHESFKPGSDKKSRS